MLEGSLQITMEPDWDPSVPSFTRKIILCIVSARMYVQTILDILKSLADEKMEGIYVSINRTSDAMIELFEQRGIPVERISIVDCVSPMVGITPSKTKKFKLVDPGSLTDINIAIADFMKEVGAQSKFLFFDSLTTLMIYNTDIAVQKFSHILTAQMRAKGLTTVLASIEKEVGGHVLKTLCQFVDQTYEVRETDT